MVSVDDGEHHMVHVTMFGAAGNVDQSVELCGNGKAKVEAPGSKFSFPFKYRLSFLQKRADAFVLVLGREAEREQIHFSPQTFIEIGTRGEFHCFLGQA